MATYLIREENMERLEKKLATLQKKCIASHCSLSYQVKGDEFKTFTNDYGEEITVRYKVVEVDGEAKYNGWRFVATIDHHDAGNVIRAYDTEIVVPDKYKSCGSTCEHCNKIRSRKDTYLIYNDELAEFKQVGKSCLQEFTNGLSADNIAFFCSIYEEMEKGYDYSGSSINRYISVEQMLNYAFETYHHFGYQKSESSFYDEEIPVGYRSTKTRVTDYYYVKRLPSSVREVLEAEMAEVNFNPESEYAVESTKSALDWIKNIEEAELNSNEYIRNLHVICSDEYTDYRSLGILVSLPVAYDRHLEKIAAYEKKQKEDKAAADASDHIGAVGDRLTVEVDSFKCISSWDTQYGTTFLYKFTDKANNVYIWYASKYIDDEELVSTVIGTVKEHSEFNNIKQTVLTRCKVSHKEKTKEVPEKGTCDVQEALDEFFEVVNAE